MRLFAKLNAFFHRGRAERELAREVDSHLALLEDEFRRRGMSPADAKLEARRAYGGISQAKELHREERSVLWLEQVLQDLHYSCRGLLKAPSFAAIAVLTLALGIGANVAIFTLVNAVLLQPLPFEQPDRLVRVFDDLTGVGAKDTGMSVPELEDLRDRSGAFEELSAIWPVSAALSGGDHTERIEMLATGTNYFQLLRAKPALGRTYGEQDAMPGFTDGVVISDGLWQRQFGGDPHVLGRRIRVDEDGYTIIGVMPPSFRHPGQTLTADVELWAAAGFSADPFPKPLVRAVRFLPGAIGRLKSGLDLRQAQQRLNSVVAELSTAYPKEYPPEVRWSLRIEAVDESLTAGVRPTLLLLLAAVGFVLLIVCVNLASLLIARSSARMRELSIRKALGASRPRLVRQLLTESLVVSLTGGVAALIVLALAKKSLLALMPPDVPRLAEVNFDSRVVGVALLLSILTGICFGLMPALHVSGTDPNRDLKEGGRSGSSKRQNRFRGVLVTAEIALSVVLLIGAGLLVRSFWGLLHVNPGLDPNGLMMARIWIPQPNNPKANRYRTSPQAANLVRELQRQVRQLPGVQDVAVGGGGSLPFLGHQRNVTVSLPDSGDFAGKNWPAEPATISPEYFRVLKTPLVRGRFFTDQDTDKTKKVAMVNESFARKYAGGVDLVGKRLRAGPWVDWEIVGLVGDLRDDGLDVSASPHVYYPIYQTGIGELGIFLRGAFDPRSLKETVARTVQAVDPDLPVYGVRTMDELMSASLARRRFSLSLMALFAGLALFLAAIGVYGVMAYAVSQRTSEFGLRMALGAQHRDIVLLALRPGMFLTLTGLAVGLSAALAVTRLMSTLLFGISPMDPLTFLGVPLVLAAVALLACWIPARRAVRVSPVVALRS
jgi:putative ABC transport system permease protein